MILDARSMKERGVFVEEATGRLIRYVRRYDTDSYEYEAFRSDPEVAKVLGIDPRRLLYRGRAQLRFVVAAEKPKGRIAPSTPLEEIRREVLAGRKQATPVLLIAGLKPPECDEPKCHRQAVWQTAAEQIVEPEKDTVGVLHERAVTVGVARWCDWHFRLPIQVSQRGVESEVAVLARPQ